ncbi:MAG: TasA family protein [Eubacteriales bacterium]|nr:TasA family protein [Eubacteriales bacterium]
MKKKILALCLVVALAATAVIGGTLAYFTDTDNKINTFTVGNLDIALNEDEWVADNAKDITPGTSVPKNPVVVVVANSVDSYVRVTVKMPSFVYDASDFFHDNESAMVNFAGQSTDFEVVGDPIVADGFTTVVLKYKAAVPSATTDTELPAIFTSVDFSASITQGDDLYKSMAAAKWDVVVTAYAVQADNTESESKAFTTAFDKIFSE